MTDNPTPAASGRQWPCALDDCPLTECLWTPTSPCISTQPTTEGDALVKIEPIRKPERHERKSKAVIIRKNEAEICLRRYRKQKPGSVQSGARFVAESLVPFKVTMHYQSQDVTEPAFSKP